jgi:cytohesin
MSEADISLEAEIARENELNDAIYRFNVKPQRGITVLCAVYGVEADPPNIARLIHTINGLEGKRIGDFLSRPENSEILREYYRQINLSNKPLLAALRAALGGKMTLPIDSDGIDRCVEQFAHVFLEQNPETKIDFDSIHLLCFSIIMLNTDLHAPRIPRRMTHLDFINNIRGCVSVETISDVDLIYIYNDIKYKELKFSGASRVTLAFCAPEIKGMLSKKTDSFFSTWTEHFFVLADSCLYYFNKPGDVSPLGLIKLSDVSVSIFEQSKFRILIDGGDIDVQYVKYQKKQGPRLVKGVKTVKLEIKEKDTFEKWFYRLRQSVVFSNFNNQSSAHMGRKKEEEPQVSSFEMEPDPPSPLVPL